MHYTYIIKSTNYNFYYVGISSDVLKRLEQHNHKRTRSTKNYAPFTMVYKKEFDTRSEARDYGKFLKVRSNKEKLLKSLGKF